jgi:predicted ATPase/DNA-binding CsgD family transcriptional regulator
VGRYATGGVHGFPAALTSFVGRAEALSGVAGLLDQYRLVTVTGPGGAGKTRLAGVVADRVADRFADGVWLAELSAVRDPAQVPAAVAGALRIPERPGLAASGALARVLARQQVLLVLDNCEHVVGAAAELCAGLLSACDDVRILATSREPLRVAGESRYRLAPLMLPDPGDPADASRCEAAMLFADRARRADARFVLDSETGPAVARLVARLDGMPLAIELAAARVEALGVAQLLDRIDDRFGLLVSGDRQAAARHRSLEATVDWSYRLLSEPDQRVFRRISVFPGPFTLEGAEAVAGAGAGSAVLRLVDCSLVAPPRTDPDGRSRYLMLDTLRAYGTRLLAEAGEANGAAAALAAFALDVAWEAAEGLVTGSREAAGVRHLDAEDATLRQGVAWAVEHDQVIAQRLAVALAWWWLLRGRLVDQLPLLRSVVSSATEGSAIWLHAQLWLGRLLLYSADPAGALRHFTLARDALGDRAAHGLLAASVSARSWALLDLGRVDEAAEDARRALTLAREVGHPALEAPALACLGMTASLTGDRAGAVRLARQAQQVGAEVPGAIGRVFSTILTALLIEAGDLAAAEQVCAAGLARSRELGDLWNLGNLLSAMAFLDLRANRVEDAAAHLREQIQIALRSGFRSELLTGLDCCAYLCAATGRFAEAATVRGALDVLRGPEGPRDLRPHGQSALREETLRAVRQALGPDRARAAEERGAAMSLTTTAEYALLLTAAGPEPPAAGPAAGRLSARERELVTLVAQGHTDAQIAAQLCISVRTVNSHLDRIRDKTGCRRRADLTRLALSAGLI